MDEEERATEQVVDTTDYVVLYASSAEHGDPTLEEWRKDGGVNADLVIAGEMLGTTHWTMRFEGHAWDYGRFSLHTACPSLVLVGGDAPLAQDTKCEELTVMTDEQTAYNKEVLARRLEATAAVVRGVKRAAPDSAPLKVPAPAPKVRCVTKEFTAESLARRVKGVFKVPHLSPSVRIPADKEILVAISVEAAAAATTESSTGVTCVSVAENVRVPLGKYEYGAPVALRLESLPNIQWNVRAKYVCSL